MNAALEPVETAGRDSRRAVHAARRTLVAQLARHADAVERPESRYTPDPTYTTSSSTEPTDPLEPSSL